jgi:hypothetical protein
MSDNEKKIKEIQANKKKWLIPKGFNSHVGRATSTRHKLISNYVGLTPSQIPVLHRFREVDKKKWIAPKNFLVV